MSKELDQSLIEKDKEIARLQKEITAITSRAMKVHEKNTMLAASPEISLKIAEMDYELRIADQFIKSGAFPSMTPEQAFTIIQAGKEMGMKPMESMNGLYIVKGSINPYGKAMVSRLVNHGYRIEYLNETEKSVSVRVTKGGFDVVEKVTDDDPILKRSNAMKISSRNKMRFHGIRMIINFHLAHIFSGVSDMFTEFIDVEDQTKGIDIDRTDYEKERGRILIHINESKTVEELYQVFDMINEYDVEDLYDEKYDELEKSGKDGKK